MSTVLSRLNAVFPDLPIICSPVPTHALHPDKAIRWHDMLAKSIATLAGTPDGGILVLGLTSSPPHGILGVRHPKTWAAALHRLASSLVPPAHIEVEAGQEEGRALLAARVHPNPVTTDQSAVSEAVLTPKPPVRAPLLEPVADSSHLWLDPDVAAQLGLPAPVDWSRETRMALAKDGLLASDGSRLTHAGLLLAAVPEHRTEDMVILVNRGDRVTVLEQGWLLVRSPLRRELSAIGAPHAERIIDVVLDVFARTALPQPTWPSTLFLSPERVTIEAGAHPTGDGTLLHLLARRSRWRPGSQRALAEHNVHITSVPGERGLCVQIDLDPREAPRTRVSISARPKPTPAATGSERAGVPIPAKPKPISPTPPPGFPSEPTAIAMTCTPQPRERREAAVLALLADGRSWTRRALDEQLGWSRSTLRNILEALVTSGRIVTEVSSPRSPHQAYRAA